MVDHVTRLILVWKATTREDCGACVPQSTCTMKAQQKKKKAKRSLVELKVWRCRRKTKETKTKEKRVLSVSHSLCEKTGLAVQCLTKQPPTTDNLSSCHTLSHPPAECRHTHTHTRTLIPTPPSVSLRRIILHPPPSHKPSLSKNIFPRVWNEGGHLGCWREEPKVVHTRRSVRSKRNKTQKTQGLNMQMRASTSSR